MKALQLNIKTKNRVDTVQLMLKAYMLLNKIKMRDSEIKILATLIIHRPVLKTRRYIMKEMKIFKQPSSYYNAICKFKKLKLIIEDEDKNFHLNPIIDLNEDKLGIIVKIDLEEEQVVKNMKR